MAALTAAKGGAPLSRAIEDYPEGIVLPVDKPFSWTSADVIRKVKFAAARHFGKHNLKVGHAGTLDPLATGVLIVCIGKATKLAESIQKSDKEYIAGISFGATTPSYDLEKPIDATFPTESVNKGSILKALEGFLGEQEQVAPLFSAKSVDGIRAYELARKLYRSGGSLDEKAESLLSRQKINISGLEMVSFDPDGPEAPAPEAAEGASGRINVCDNSALHLPTATVRIACSKGTYIRAFARDLGEALGSGAHLSSLRRTACGEFRVENSLCLDEALAFFS